MRAARRIDEAGFRKHLRDVASVEDLCLCRFQGASDFDNRDDTGLAGAVDALAPISYVTTEAAENT